MLHLSPRSLPFLHTFQIGMLVEILKESDKKKPKSPNQGDTCEVTYSGTLKDGTPFDSGTTTFAPNQVIRGWTEAMQLMVEVRASARSIFSRFLIEMKL